MNVLFVCTDNAALSLIAESILNSVAPGRFAAFSAACGTPGAQAAAGILDFLTQHRLSVNGLRPKRLDEFCSPGAPRMDFVITLGETAAEESYAELPGAPFVAHWSVDDADAASEIALRDCFWTLMRRIKIFASLPEARLSRRVLERRALTLQPAYL